jgi:DNA-binding transcriptional LysR family regulator
VSLDLRLIRYATVLAEHGNFTRAAEALGIAQPSLSRGIKDLEETLGLALFTRHRHGAEPTDFGYVFLQHAATLSAQFADLEREVAIAKGVYRGELAVGLGPYAAELLMPRALPRFMAGFPAVCVRVQVDTIEALGRALRQRSLDLVVGESTVLEDDESTDVFEPLEPIDAYVVVRAGHPLAGTNASLRDVLDYPLVNLSRLPPRALRPILDELGASAKRRLSHAFPAVDCPSVSLAVQVVLASDAVMLASLGNVKRELASGRMVPVLHLDWMRSHWAFMKLRHRSFSPAENAFVAALRAAHAACVGEERRLEKRWRTRLPPPLERGG